MLLQFRAFRQFYITDRRLEYGVVLIIVESSDRSLVQTLAYKMIDITPVIWYR